MDAWCRWYPPDLFPTVWTRLESLITQGHLISSEEVLRELERKEDALFAWANAHKAMFLPLSEDVQAATNTILAQFRTLVDGRTGKSFADPFIIATAQVTGTVVVTGEQPTGRPDRPKIPDVCAHFGIPWINTVELFKREKWRF